MSFNRAVNARISFRGFRHRSSGNPHGWGLAYYPDESAQVFKEPISAKRSELAEFVGNYKGVKSRIFIAHVRFASRGGLARKNTHPFQRELNGRDYVFAHNGTMGVDWNYDMASCRPIGDTDSELVFCHILSKINERGIEEWSKEDFIWLQNLAHELNSLGSLNFMLSDGTFLFAYHDSFGYNSLYHLRREAPYHEIRLLDEDWMVNLSEEKSTDTRGYIIATKPLTDEKWVKFKNGEMIVVRDGEIVFDSR